MWWDRLRERIFKLLYEPRGTFKCIETHCGALLDGSEVYIKFENGVLKRKCGKHCHGGMIWRESRKSLLVLNRALDDDGPAA